MYHHLMAAKTVTFNAELTDKPLHDLLKNSPILVQLTLSGVTAPRMNMSGEMSLGVVFWEEVGRSFKRIIVYEMTDNNSGHNLILKHSTLNNEVQPTLVSGLRKVLGHCLTYSLQLLSLPLV